MLDRCFWMAGVGWFAMGLIAGCGSSTHSHSGAHGGAAGIDAGSVETGGTATGGTSGRGGADSGATTGGTTGTGGNAGSGGSSASGGCANVAGAGGGCAGDACTPNPCIQPNRTVCTVEQGLPVCKCDPGTHDDGTACVIDQTCLPTTCGDHGTCSDSTGAIACSCQPGYTGSFCSDCDTAAGYILDLSGGCTNTPCAPNPCPLGKSQCRVSNNQILCDCDPGTHDDNGACVPDNACLTGTCSGHGQCSTVASAPVCTCDAGWALPYCAECDSSLGYHPNGLGGCTTDPCSPNPCIDAHKGVCTAASGASVCSCDPGFHDQQGTCVVDQTCSAGSCSGHGQCSDAGGVVTCSCDTGYVGTTCDACDTTGGYHADGAGGCTNDPCVPNPCIETNRTACTAQGALAVCGCDSGFHDDGVGGCTTDPCVPNLCAAQNQACRNDNGQAVCYTPACDDQNPCTADSLVQGKCVNTPLADGTACSTSLCITGQTCQSAACTGGGPTDCADDNPCTRDGCDPVTGCSHTVDVTIVPSDGVACTVDSCASGAPSHTPDDAACDDGSYCNGTEVCTAAGCVHTNVPQAPTATGPCFSYGPCNEASHGFPLIQKPAGTACNDGIPCTQTDVCTAAGACAGIPTASCSIGGCATTQSLSSTFDIPVTTISGSVTLNGGALPATNTYGLGADLFLVSKDTGAWHHLAYFNYTGTTNTLYGPAWTTKLVPGVYDLYFDRAWSSSTNQVSDTTATDAIPHGLRILKSNVVLGVGANTLAVDVPVATVSGTITLGGQPLPSTNTYGLGADLFLVSKDTGAWHHLAYFNYTGTTNTLYGPTWTTKLVPGVYDLYYDRAWSSSTNQVSDTTATDAIPHGLRILQQGVVLNPGANTLAVDIPVATVTGSVTLGGQPLPATNTYGLGTDLFLVSKDTGAWHHLAYFNYTGTTNTLYGPTWTTKVVPGVYDVYYDRAWSSSTNQVSDTTATDAIPHGLRILKSDVVLASGSNTLDLDIPVATVSGSITLAGGALPATNTYGLGTDVFLVSKDTGAWHHLAYFNYTGTTNTLYGPAWTTKLLPGVYDVIYDRAYSTSTNQVSDTTATDAIPHGLRILESNFVIGTGSNTLDLDIPVATVSGTVTLAGRALPATNTYGLGTDLFLVSKDTGAWHHLAYFNYTGTTNTLYGPAWTTKLLPGDYDLYYDRAYSTSTNQVSDTTSTDAVPHGLRILESDIVLAADTNTLAIDIPSSAMGGTLTLAGQALPATNTYGIATDLFLVSKDTGAWHHLGYFNYTGTTNTLYGPTWTTKIVPGVYDVYFDRAWSSSTNQASDTTSTDAIPHGLRLLGQCVAIP